MSIARYAAKRDANEAQLVDALQRLGWSVLKVSEPGAPDLVCGRGAALVLVEVKGDKGQLRASQRRFRERWRGPAPVVVRTLADVEALR